MDIIKSKTILLLVIVIAACNNVSKPPKDYFYYEPLTNQEARIGKLTPGILWKFGRLIEAELSPNGEWLIFTVTRYNLSENRGNTEIFIVSSKGGEPVQLTFSNESESNIKWSPDGSKIGYLCSSGNISQIWEMKPDGSGKHKISSAESDIEIFDYSPDGKHVFFTSRVKTDTSAPDLYPDLPKTGAMIINDLMYRHWDSWTDYKHSHIFIADYLDGKISGAKDIMKSEPFDSPLSPYFEPEEISWSPDGKSVAYTCKKLKGKAYTLSTNSDIYLYSLESGKTTNITEGMPGYDRFPVFSPDGKKIAWQSMATAGYESDKDRLMVLDLKSGTKRDLTAKFDQSVSNIVWNETGSSVYFISGIKATYQVYRADIASGNIYQLTKGNHDYTYLNRKNGILIGERMSISMPVDVFKIDESGNEQQLTFTNKNIYAVIKTSKVQERWVKTTDNKKELVWVIFPPDFDSTKKYPAILYCEGGPQIAVSQFFNYRWNFQLMAANGYIVIAPNRRGLPTFGSEWNDQIAGDYGGQNMKDYLSAVDEIKKEPYIDANRIGAVGASYGGYSVFYLAGCHQKRFKAFIAHCGYFNMESQYAETDEVFFSNHDLGGPYWASPRPKSYDFSPHKYVQNWDAPILIITGVNDFRIPYTESIQAFNAAQLRGIPSRLIIFRDENHWVLKPQNGILWQTEFFKWLDKWLK
jgi:dipeptidyl aminopeptidase/acylaminoacyl peptidase